MTLLADTRSLAAFCRGLANAPYVTVDTEFIRDRTYWSRLCVVQMAGDGPDGAVAVDAQAKGIDLSPVFELMANKMVLKVFHSARQDIEIFYYLSGAIPAPLFDTQVAAMVCGFGESVAYETLVAKLAKARLDKSSRFTDWSHRPLSKRQIDYALADVIHLRTVYEKLARRLDESGRAGWLDEEMATLTDPETYKLEPSEAWRRLKTRSHNRRFFAVLRELAAWRETEAQTRDVPRNRVIRDDALLEIAAHTPRSGAELARCRSVSRGLAEGRAGAGILEAVARGAAVPDDACPEPPLRTELAAGLKPVVELLRVALKMKCEDHGVAQKLVASTADLEMIAADDDAPVAALHGWRREVFGADALALKHGRLALTIRDRRAMLVPAPAPKEAAEGAPKRDTR
jgi:ribonuclease D